MEIEVWMENDVELSNLLSEEDGWEALGTTWSWASQDWTIQVGEPWAPEEEDIPDEIREVMPQAHLLMEWSLNPATAPEEAREVLLQAAQDVAAACGGIVYDPLEAVVYVPAELDA